MAQYRSIQLFSLLFALSLLLSTALALEVTGQLSFAVRLAPEAAATLAARIQLIRFAGLLLALVLMLLVSVAASRASRSALAARWVLSVGTSFAFLRGSGLVQPLALHDALFVGLSTFQLLLEGVAILLLFGQDASEWFTWRR